MHYTKGDCIIPCFGQYGLDGLASRDGLGRARFRLSLHFPVPLASCIPNGYAF